MDSAISARSLSKSFGSLRAVDDVSLDVLPGELFVVMGLSGSGKSTLLRCIARLVEPDSGAVLINGENILTATPARVRELRRTTVSTVFQHFGLLPHRTVTDNIAYGLEIAGVDRKERLRRAHELIGVVGLDGFAGYYPDELSGGMQQRVGLARALAANPEVLLLDEPFSALDPVTRRDMQVELARLHRDLRTTMVFITHSLAEAVVMGDRLAIMRAGRIVQTGVPAEIVAAPADEEVATFVRGIRKFDVLTLASIARPLRPGESADGPEVDAGTVIRDATATIAASAGPVRVRSAAGVIGVVSSDDVLALID